MGAQQHTATDDPRLLSVGKPSSLRRAALCLLGLVVLYRPMASGVTCQPAPVAVFGLLLLGATFLWLCGGLLERRIRIRFGWTGAIFAAYLIVCLISSLRSENWFSGMEWCLLVATYGLTAFLVLQMSGAARARNFLLSCFLATAAALAAYALWHRILYMPALRRWLADQPGFFQTALQVQGAQFEDLKGRLLARRAYGNFITPNQLAAFLSLALFPLAGLILARRQGGEERQTPPVPARRVRLLGAVPLLLMAAALCLTGSKGGWLAFAAGLALFCLTAAGSTLARHKRKVLVGAAAVVVLAAIAWRAEVLPGRERLAASFGVRAGYWRTSVDITFRRPYLGIGPGSWGDWYAMMKAPEFGESQSPHSLWLLLWTETGVVGLALFLILCVAVARHAWRGCREERRLRTDPAGDAVAPPETRWMLTAGVCISAAALFVDYVAIGTFLPPAGHVPRWLSAMPYLAYVVVFGVWAATFASLFVMTDHFRRAVPVLGMLVAALVLLLHSAGEFTLEVPAIGSGVAVLAGLMLGTGRPIRRRSARLHPLAAGIVFVFCAGLLVCWSFGVTRRALIASANRRAAENLRAELVTDSRARPGTTAVRGKGRRGRRPAPPGVRRRAVGPSSMA